MKASLQMESFLVKVFIDGVNKLNTNTKANSEED